MALITETWLNEDTWVLTSEQSRNQFHLGTSNQIGKRGGGLGLISRSYLKTRKIMEGNQKMFQHAKWKVETHDNSVTCIVIYRPPYSSKNQETVTKFLVKFTELLANILGSFSNVIVLGDFNVHINDENDNEAGIFDDTITAFGFNQHITFPTHWKGNIIYLAFIETCNSIKVKSCRPGPILSDHMVVDIVMAQASQPIQRKLIKYRKLKDINNDQLNRDLEVSDTDTGSIDDMVGDLESKLLQALNKHAPKITKTVTIRHRILW